MKKVIYGQRGGFPLEQETLTDLQDAYSKDLLEALLATWGVETNKRYLVKSATTTSDGFILTKVPRPVTINGVTETRDKMELVRLKYSEVLPQPFYVNIYDSYTTGLDGTCDFASSGEHKIYEELYANYATQEDEDALSHFEYDLITLPTVLGLQQEINNISMETIGDNGTEVYTEKVGSKFKLRKLDGKESQGVTETLSADGKTIIFGINQTWLRDYIDNWLQINRPKDFSANDFNENDFYAN